MNRRLVVLAFCALGLAAFVVWDNWPKTMPVEAVQPAPTQPKATDMLNPLSQRPMDDFQSLFDHPLFTPTRTPPAPLVTPDAPVIPEPAVDVAPDPVVPPKPVLMGLVTSPKGDGAYLGDDSGGPVVFLRKGQSAQGLTLQRVLANSAVFSGASGPVTLTLQDAPMPDAPVPDALVLPDMTPTPSTTLPSP